MSELVDLLRGMKRIRAVEEGIAARYSVQPQPMRCPTHLSIGQELVGAAAGIVFSKSDYAVSSHRGHAHYVGKGGDMGAMLAEIYGKEAGCSRGRGGSMHLIDESVGFMGTTAIVGNSIPVGVGLGMAAKLDRKGQISVVFLGDGSTEEGSFYEAATFAAVRKLPVLFVCENNLYSVYSPLTVRQPPDRVINKMVEAYGGIKTYFVEGDDPEATLSMLKEAADYVRSGEGPAFIEITTYRWREHCGPNYDNDLPYREEEEFESWKARDPLASLSDRLAKRGDLTGAAVAAMDSAIKTEVDEAFRFAADAPFPDASEAFIDEYQA